MYYITSRPRQSFISTLFLILHFIDTNAAQDINIDVMPINGTSDIIVHGIVCYSNWNPLFCTTEVLSNGSTIDDIRQSNGSCYHKKGKCYTNVCSCNCSYFILYVNVPHTVSNLIYTCTMTFEHFVASVSIQFNKTGFFRLPKESNMLDQITSNPVKNITNSIPEVEQNNGGGIYIIIVVVGLVALCICILMCVTVWINYYRKRQSRKQNNDVEQLCTDSSSFSL